MTMADDPRIHSPLAGDEAVGNSTRADDVLPESEREHDPARAGYMRSLVDSPAHPLTGDEKEAARTDPGVGERVYAPASERVPKEPVPGHDEIVDDIDPNTPERRAAGWHEPVTSSARPAPTSYDTGATWTDDSPSPDWRLPAAALGAAALVGALGGWLYYLRWKREQNRPINRLRRQARQVVYVVGDRLPSRDEVVDALPSADQARPAGGASLLAVALALLVRGLLQRRSRQEEMVDDARGRLADASDRWTDKLFSFADRARDRAAETGSKARDRVDDVSPNGHFRLLPFRS